MNTQVMDEVIAILSKDRRLSAYHVIIDLLKKFNAWTRTTFVGDGTSKNVERGKLRKRFKFPKHFFKEVASDSILKEKNENVS